MQKIPLLSLAHANLLSTDVPTPLKEANIQLPFNLTKKIATIKCLLTLDTVPRLKIFSSLQTRK
jgi:hypothetical protein